MYRSSVRKERQRPYRVPHPRGRSGRPCVHPRLDLEHRADVGRPLDAGMARQAGDVLAIDRFRQTRYRTLRRRPGGDGCGQVPAGLPPWSFGGWSTRRALCHDLSGADRRRGVSTERARELGDRAGESYWRLITHGSGPSWRGFAAANLTRPVMGSGDVRRTRPRRPLRPGDRTLRPRSRDRGARRVHTGELELAGGDIRGIAVHVGARVCGIAGPDEVLVTSTVRDLVAGSGLVFKPRGEYELRGAGKWTLFAANDSPSVGTPQPARLRSRHEG
jgi:hypothetical protein